MKAVNKIGRQYDKVRSQSWKMISRGGLMVRMRYRNERVERSGAGASWNLDRWKVGVVAGRRSQRSRSMNLVLFVASCGL